MEHNAEARTGLKCFDDIRSTVSVTGCTQHGTLSAGSTLIP